MKLRFILCVIIAMALAFTAAAQQPSSTPKNLLRGKQEIIKTGEDAAGNSVWEQKDPPPARRATPKPAPPYINSFDGNTQINAGDTATLHFSVSGAKTVTINGQDVTGGNQLVVAPTATTVYHLVATNAGGRVAEDRVVQVKPATAPASTDWAKLIDDWWWLIILILLACLAAYGIGQWLNHRRWREEQAAWREDSRLRQNEAPAMPQPQQQPAPFTFNQTINIGGGDQPVIAETAAPQPVAVAPEAAAADPMTGETPAQLETPAVASTQTQDNSEPGVVAQNDGTK